MAAKKWPPKGKDAEHSELLAESPGGYWGQVSKLVAKEAWTSSHNVMWRDPNEGCGCCGSSPGMPVRYMCIPA